MSWLTSEEDITIDVKIYDTENIIDDGDSPVVYDLVPTGNPCIISIINNDRKKYGIKAKQAKLEFYSVPGVNAYNFADSNDQRWLVEIKTGSEMIFTGFVVLSDLSRPFMPDKAVITLTASDGLGLLKEKPFLIGGSNPQGKLLLGQILHYCLFQTGLNLEMAVHNNVRAYYDGTFLSSIHHLYNTIGVDVKTFEKAIGESEDCYTILEKIIDKDCYLFQYRNRWWIMRPDDFDGNDAYIAYFNLSGVPYDYETLDNSRNLGVGQDNFFINAAQIVEYERPYKFAKHTFKYETPEELVCNIDFSRGAFIADLPDFTIGGIDYTAKSYNLDCWTTHSEGSGDPGNTADIYIRKDFTLQGLENSRYVVIEQSADWNFIKSNTIDVQRNDKFEFSFEMNLSSDVSGSGSYSEQIAQVRLYGDDGTYWTFSGEDGSGSLAEWYQCNSTFTTNQKYFVIEGDLSQDMTVPQSIFSGKVSPIPVSGYVQILIYQYPSFRGGRSTHIHSMRFDYQPFINGSYQVYTGQSSKVSRSNYSANIDEDVHLSDSPKPSLKGAMFYYDGGTWRLHNEYFNATPHGNSDPPDTSYVHPFEYIRVFANFNQYRRGLRYFSGDVYGLTATWPDLYHKWFITDTDIDSIPRTFMLLSFEQNWKTCKWSGVFAETYHTDGKVFSDDFTFKYEK